MVNDQPGPPFTSPSGAGRESSRRKVPVLVLVGPEIPEASFFKQAIARCPGLSNTIDLAFAAREDALPLIKSVQVVACGKISGELLAAATSLRWISFWHAGLDKQITPEMTERRLLITNASGVHGPNIAEHVLAFMLMFCRRMPFYGRAQASRQWTHNFDAGAFEELSGKTLGIAGLGRIGEALCARARALGMRVVATKRDTSARYDSNVAVDELFTPDRLPEMLGVADHLCVALPYAPATHHLFDAAMLSHMKQSAYLYNISRGRVVDEIALIAALNEGRLRGAGLDVFEDEPLPPASPLWDMANVIITPHVAGLTPYYFERAAALFAANLERYVDRRPLQNLYNPERGY